MVENNFEKLNQLIHDGDGGFTNHDGAQRMGIKNKNHMDVLARRSIVIALFILCNVLSNCNEESQSHRCVQQHFTYRTFAEQLFIFAAIRLEFPFC